MIVYDSQTKIDYYDIGDEHNRSVTNIIDIKNQLKSQSSMRVITRGDPMFDKYKDDPMFDPKLGQGGVLTVSSGGVGKGQGGCSGDSGGPLFCTM